MTALGLCISPGFVPTAEETSLLNPPFYRSIIYTLADLARLKSTGKPILLTLNNQCQEVSGDWSGWDTTVQQIHHILGDQLLILGCGNEFDLYWSANENDVPPEFAADLVHRTARILRGAHSKVAACSVTSNRWPEYLARMAKLCADDADYFDIHPYGQQPDNWGPSSWMFGRLTNCINSATSITGKPVICSEYGVKIGDAGGEQEVANFLNAARNTLNNIGVPYASWFAWHDAVGAPSERGPAAFGLRAEDSHPRLAWTIYKMLSKGHVDWQPGEESHVPNLDKWRATVGKGLLDMMQQDNTEPAMNSEFRPFDRPSGSAATVEQCIGMNGVQYLWHIPTGNHWRYKPS